MLKNYLQRTGISRQLTVVVTVAILCLALFSALMNAWEASRRMREYLIEQGLQISSNLAMQSTLALLYRSAENAKDGVTTTLAFPDVMRVEIVDADHKVLLSQAKTGKFEIPAHAPIVGAQAMLIHETAEMWVFAAPVYSGQKEAEAESPFELQERKPQLLGNVHVVLGKGTLQRLASSLMIGNILMSVSFALVLLGLIRLLTRRMIRPLDALSELMRRAEAGESGLRAKPQGPRDIINMGIAFNRMMQVLEEREAELKMSRDEAVRTALMKSQFAATVSHEVRTPLNGVVGMLDMLKEMRLTKRQQECVDVAWSSSQALIELITDILDFSKMEAGKLVLEEVEFSLRKLIEETMELLAKSAQQKNLQLGYLMAPDVPERIKGDSLRLRQVLINLIGNAVKFTESGEIAIRISLGSAETGDGATALCLHFEVSDTGIGMSADAAKHVFESFVQAERSTTRKYGGTGLGLAICRQLVELMQGEIGLTSQLGRGTTFWFVVRCQPGTVRTPTLQDPALQGARVLLMDSSEIVRSFLQQSLAQLGMHVHVAISGDEALAELSRAAQFAHPYAVAIIDAGMADELGLELARRIRADVGLAQTRLLMLDRYGVTSLGARAPSDVVVLNKPLRLDRLQECLRHLLAANEGAAANRGDSAKQTPELSSRGREYRILVAEDNRTNQMVAAGMLAMNGCQCELAVNGREAMEAAYTDRYDLILMDCSMPEMDGYEATAHIRLFEETQGRRTPIVAMTANAQQGDVEKCLSAGMDDYLAKPITLVELRSKLNRWLHGKHVESGAESRVATAAAEVVDDVPLDRAIFENLREVLGPSLQQAVAPFLEDTPESLVRLERAVSEKNAETARAMAHTIKGSSSNLGAVALAQLAKVAEELALGQKIEDIAALLPRLRKAYDEVAALLSAEVFVETRVGGRTMDKNSLVLVVDDDRSTRSTLRYTLQREGFRVEEAENGAQALVMLRRIQPDVILMDAMMPVMDGFEACGKIQELPQGRAIPVLMITALEDNTSVERAFAAGASDYIPKPIHFAVLSQRVRRVIDANRAEQRIRHLAYNDPLTGLPNRTLFASQLELSIEQARQAGEIAAVLFLDLDRFKYVNDTLGHDVGDHLLVAVAQRLRRCVRNGDSVARLGGDEFTVVMANIDAPKAAEVAQDICRSLCTPFQIDGHTIFISTSVGISLYPHDGGDVGSLLKHADTAMYRAKKTKVGFQFFETEMERSISDRMRLENDLRGALEREELEVYYQPQALFDNGRVIGMEALVRWHHPVRGMVSPVEFIPLAEDTGLIIALGEWVLRTACTQIQAWINAGLPAMKVAVNLSVQQLMQKDFPATVENVLIEVGLEPSLLELEITESSLMEHAEDTLQTLHRLRSIGIRMSIDDFGTGYSSLAYLKKFPIDIVKIDRSFVRDVCEDADDAAIVTGIIALAHSLRLKVVAEGVQNEAQLRFLRQRCCDIVQGFLLSKPVTALAFAREFMTADKPHGAARNLRILSEAQVN